MECDLIGGKVPLVVTCLITMTKHLTGETMRGEFILSPAPGCYPSLWGNTQRELEATVHIVSTVGNKERRRLVFGSISPLYSASDPALWDGGTHN